MGDALSMSTKGRPFGPESKASQGYLFKRGIFQIYAAVKAKWVFKRERVLRVFKREREQ
jgi:hypothetical protein